MEHYMTGFIFSPKSRKLLQLYWKIEYYQRKTKLYFWSNIEQGLEAARMNAKQVANETIL